MPPPKGYGAALRIIEAAGAFCDRLANFSMKVLNRQFVNINFYYAIGYCLRKIGNIARQIANWIWHAINSANPIATSIRQIGNPSR